MTVLEFPRDFYDKVIGQKFTLRSMSQAAALPWSGAGASISGPHTQLWLSEVTMAPMRDPDLQDMDALLTSLKGRSNVLRMSNALRLAPWYDRNITPTVSTWSDGSLFTEGTGFANGYLPPDVYVHSAAVRGANYIVLGGFPASTSAVIRRGDLLQIKPNGIAGTVPHLYKAAHSNSSDASGLVGIEISPRLRAGIAAGDQVGLRYPSTLFRLIDDGQGDIEVADGGIGNFGFSLVEALDLVP